MLILAGRLHVATIIVVGLLTMRISEVLLRIVLVLIRIIPRLLLLLIEAHMVVIGVCRISVLLFVVRSGHLRSPHLSLILLIRVPFLRWLPLRLVGNPLITRFIFHSRTVVGSPLRHVTISGIVPRLMRPVVHLIGRSFFNQLSSLLVLPELSESLIFIIGYVTLLSAVKIWILLLMFVCLLLILAPIIVIAILCLLLIVVMMRLLLLMRRLTLILILLLLLLHFCFLAITIVLLTLIVLILLPRLALSTIFLDIALMTLIFTLTALTSPFLGLPSILDDCLN